MSQWRQTLMAYGNMFGDAPGAKSSRSSSNNFSTLDRALRDKRNDEAELMRNLEVHFRPLFQSFVYGGEKIACHDLRRILRDPEYRHRLPIDKVHELADLADFNMGRSMTYDEFVRIVLNKPADDDMLSLHSEDYQDPRKPSAMANLVAVVCRNTEPQIMVEEKARKYHCFPPPFFMILISMVEIIVFIYFAAEEKSVKPLQGVDPFNRLMYMPTRRRECWRFLTYFLLHQGYVDLILNIVIQIVIGFPLEIMFSWWRLAAIYIMGVVCGSLGQSLVDFDVGLVGAAGGAYAIVGAHLVSMWRNRKRLNGNEMEGAGKRCICSITLRVILLLVVAICGLALAVCRRWELGSIDLDLGEPKIGIAAHVAGLISGAIMSDAFLQDHKHYPWTANVGLMDLFGFLMFAGVAVIVNIVYDGYPSEDRTSLSTFLDQTVGTGVSTA